MSIWNKLRRHKATSKWDFFPSAEGLCLRWRIGDRLVLPSTSKVPSDSDCPEAHALLFQHLRAMEKDRFLVDGQVAVSAQPDGFLLSNNAVYAGFMPEEVSEESAACRGLFEWLPYLFEGLPEVVPSGVSLTSKGDFASPVFSVSASLLPFRHRDSKAFQRLGPFLEYSDGSIELLPRATFKLLQQLDEPWPRDPLDRMRRWAKLTPLVTEAEAKLDAYLTGEDLVLVDRIRPVSTEYASGRLHLDPGVGDAEHPGEAHSRDADFAPATTRFGEPQSLYNVPVKPSQLGKPPRPGRTRFVLTEEAQGALGIMKERSSLSGSDAVRSLTAAEQIFNHPGFDLEGYSDRVIGVGVYVYRALPYLGTPGEKRRWFEWDGDDIPEFGLELTSNIDESENERLPLGNYHQIEAIQKKLLDASARGDTFVEISEGHFAPCTEVQEWVNQAEALLKASSPEKRKRLVFQILENIENRDYTAARFATISSAMLLPPPATLAPSCQLLAHQVSGYSWLCSHTHSGAAGASLLADEMGLGKTLQVLCTLAERRRQGLGSSVLVVAPVSLLVNWQREAERFFPGLFKNVIILSNSPATTAEELGGADLVLSSYETLRGQVQFEAGRVNWDMLVLDEAQRIKNPTTQTSIAIKSLKAQCRIAMTATPVENSLAELWNIVDFLLPGYLGSLKEFHKEYILAYQNVSEKNRNDISERLIAQLQPILLRRTKAEVLDIPAKRIERLFIPMSPIQDRLYREIIQKTRNKELHPLSAVRQLLQVCAHPGLIDPALSDDVCPKLESVLLSLELVQASGEKALIFTGSRQLQTLLHRALYKKFGVSVETINGSTPPPHRQSTIDRFSEHPGFAVLLLSPRAAGLGLNITAATHVIHYTRDWNPAIEAQSTDRAHRIGQDRVVTVYYPIVSGAYPGQGSAEQRLDELLQEKSVLSSSIVRPTSELEVGYQEIWEGLLAN